MLLRWYVPQNSTSYALVEKQGSKLYIGQIAGKMEGQNYTLDKLLEKYGGRSYTSQTRYSDKNARVVKLGGRNTTYFKFQVKMQNLYKIEVETRHLQFPKGGQNSTGSQKWGSKQRSMYSNLHIGGLYDLLISALP